MSKLCLSALAFFLIQPSLCGNGNCVFGANNHMEDCDYLEDNYNLAVLTGDHEWSGTDSLVAFSYKMDTDSSWSGWYRLDKCGHDDFLPNCEYEHFKLAGAWNDDAPDFFEFAVCGNDGLQVDTVRFYNQNSVLRNYAESFIDNPTCTWHTDNDNAFVVDGDLCPRVAFKKSSIHPTRWQYIEDGVNPVAPCIKISSGVYGSCYNCGNQHHSYTANGISEIKMGDYSGNIDEDANIILLLSSNPWLILILVMVAAILLSNLLLIIKLCKSNRYQPIDRFYDSESQK